MTPHRRQDKSKPTDAKALKPAILETSMPPLTLNEWFKSFDYYREASAWGSGSHKTQLAYLRMCISEEIRTAIQLDYLTTVPEAINVIKQYLEMAVMSLTL